MSERVTIRPEQDGQGLDEIYFEEPQSVHLERMANNSYCLLIYTKSGRYNFALYHKSNLARVFLTLVEEPNQ